MCLQHSSLFVHDHVTARKRNMNIPHYGATFLGTGTHQLLVWVLHLLRGLSLRASLREYHRILKLCFFLLRICLLLHIMFPPLAPEASPAPAVVGVIHPDLMVPHDALYARYTFKNLL
ncbi:hypothetical protein N665_0219s0016 [Sinapis alba]|nr:hypothetical protein N665_0219s0016 [Sinapis alba]